MSDVLLRAIHQRWAGSAALAGLLPAARVSTGASPNPSLPRAVLGLPSGRPLAACNDGSTVAAVGVRVQVFHNLYDSAAAIVRAVKSAFDRSDFPLDDGSRVIQMRWMHHAEKQQPDGIWRMAVDFTCTLCSPPSPHAPRTS